MLLATDYKRVFAKPLRSADPFFTVLASTGTKSPARLGLAIAKKQVRLAVRRNLLKRLVRERFRANRAMLDGLDLVVMARTAAGDASKADLAASLQRHFEELVRRAPSGMD